MVRRSDKQKVVTNSHCSQLSDLYRDEDNNKRRGAHRYIDLPTWVQRDYDTWAKTLLPPSTKLRGMRFILPQAPHIPSTYNNGELYPAWFDTPTLNFLDHKEDDIINQDKSVDYLLSLIKTEKAKGVKVFIGGYSQGWVARNENIRQELKVGYRAKPVFWTAGDEDDVITPAITRKSLELVDEFGIPVAPPGQSFSENGVAVKSYHCGGGDKPPPLDLKRWQG